ncbi:hypothetical protein B296_00053686 [Ensete ventricosum]|uniref:Uncharacterized protein n=1 Tax=Ensete ventricosum TaxID=4639 RepID=A0A426X9K9_ENSVE|nr:hypothetical protein B296_00053686 [Ensete ventricosum]
MVNGRLYWWGFNQPLLYCLHTTKAQTTLVEVREGICGEHIDARTLALKVLGQGLTFGTETVLPPEVVYPTLRVESYEESCIVRPVEGKP